MSAATDGLPGTQVALRAWDARFEALVAEGRKAGGETRTAYDRRLKALRLDRKAARGAMDAALVAAGAPAEKAQAEVAAACEALHKAIERVEAELHAMPRDGTTRRPAPMPPPVDAPPAGPVVP